VDFMKAGAPLSLAFLVLLTLYAVVVS